MNSIEERTIICLANSRKHSGRCLAGKRIDSEPPGAWLRPVSSRSGQEVSEDERRYEDGSDPRVLDIITVPLIGSETGEKNPEKLFQIENHTLAAEYYWINVGRIEHDSLAEWVDTPETLWTNNSETYNGQNDRVSTEDALSLRGSLYLLRLNEVNIRVFAPGLAFNNPKRRVQAQFKYRNVPYALWVTDPIVEKKFLPEPDGSYSLGPTYATISLGEPNDDGYCYKLVATLLPDGWSK